MGHFGGGGGGFGSSSGDAFSESGRSGTFGSSSNNDSHFNYNDPYYYNNQQRPYRGFYGGGGSGGGGSPDVECKKCASIFLPFFTLFGTLWMLFGLFKSDQVEMGLNYSRAIKANSLFVKGVQIRNLRDPGPVVYALSKWPPLSEVIDYTQERKAVVPQYSHQEYGFWLNEGSSIELSYEMLGISQDYLVLAFIRGRDGLEDWIRAPETPAKALTWYRIHGSGVKEFLADRDAEYFIALGNLNRVDTEFSAQLKIHSTLYNPKDAYKKTAFTSEIETFSFPVPLLGSNCAVLTTPSKPQDGADVWEVAIVYTTRWITYIIIWGTIVLAILVLWGVEYGRLRLWPRSREELPLLAPISEQPTSYTASAPPRDLDEHGERMSDDHQLCTVCLDAPKDCFFDPCGHRCACYSCGHRIQSGDSPMCPICRQPIRAVRKIFDS